MSRHAVRWGWVVLAASLLEIIAAGPACAAEDSRTVLLFVNSLREHGLHEYALQYLEILHADADLPPDIKNVLDFEVGKTLIDEAAKSNDLVRREELLKEARSQLETFAAAHPDLPQARDALVLMAKLLIERGHLALLFSEETQDKQKKEAKATEARTAFTQAHDAYAKAVDPLEAALKKYPGFIADGDPRKDERDKLHTALLDAKLQKGVSDYELAQTYPEKSPEREKASKSALEQFEALYKNYRTQLVGLAAQMYQAKCYEEQGNVDAAVGIYKQLMEHTDPRLRPLQRNVGYFYIVALSKRKQFPLAADEAVRWLATYNRKDELRSPEGLGVLAELAKSIEAQMSEISAANKPAAVRKIVDTANQIVRYASPHKKDALALLKKYKPSAAVRAEEVARLTYEDAMGQADEAMASHEWERAIALLRAAVKKADPIKNPEKANMARYNLAFSHYMNKQYYEADVLAEHLARRYPQFGLAGKGTEIAMQSLADAYNTYTEVDRGSDIKRLVDLARYTAETWPDRDEGDSARINLGMIESGMGNYDKAIEFLGAVRPRSTKWIDAQTRMAAAYWAKSRDLDRRGSSTEAATAGQKAIEIFNATLKARRDAGAPVTDPGYVGNVGDLAVALTETGKAADAIALLTPVVKAQTVKTGPGFARLMEAQLKAYVSSGQVEPAIAAMKSLEQSGGAAGRAQLYYKLGKLLEKELDTLKKSGDTRALAKMHQSYKAFLTTLASSNTGQSYESLQWAGEGLLTLEANEEAEKVFKRVLDEFTKSPEFLQDPNGRLRLLRTRVKLAAALRGQGNFDAAGSLIDDLLNEYKRYIDPRFEKGMLLEAEAAANRGSWGTALKYWERLAKDLEGARPRTVTYYDAWYHVALVLYKQKNPTKARQTLMGVMRLSRNVGSAEMKAKYDELLKRTEG
jgi:hypothetical protein